jgi:hypothetical protein
MEQSLAYNTGIRYILVGQKNGHQVDLGAH